MKKDISNKALAGLLIAAIVISLSGTMMVFDKQGGITGFATEQNGTAAINISGVVSIALPSNSIDFGTSSVVPPNAYCNVSYDGSSTTHEPAACGGWSGSGDIIVENDGNQAANVTIKARDDVATFIGGQSPGMFYKSADNESGSCSGNVVSSYTELTTSATNFCDVLDTGADDGFDTVKLHLKLKIPSDAVGYKSNTLTFEAS